MPRRSPGLVRRETDKSIAAAVRAKVLNRQAHAGPIAALRKLADQIDHPDFPVIDGRLDNVSLPTYLRYCQQLRLAPGEARAPAKGKDPEEAAGGDSNSGDAGGSGSALGNLQQQRQKRAGKSA